MYRRKKIPNFKAKFELKIEIPAINRIFQSMITKSLYKNSAYKELFRSKVHISQTFTVLFVQIRKLKQKLSRILFQWQIVQKKFLFFLINFDCRNIFIVLPAVCLLSTESAAFCHNICLKNIKFVRGPKRKTYTSSTN